MASRSKIRGYRWALYDLRDGIRRHIELDNRIFETLLGSTSMEDLAEEHEEIQKQMDGAVWLVDSAVADELVQEELHQCASNIREAVNGICGLIEAHTAKEDRLLRLMQKGL